MEVFNNFKLGRKIFLTEFGGNVELVIEICSADQDLNQTVLG